MLRSQSREFTSLFCAINCCSLQQLRFLRNFLKRIFAKMFAFFLRNCLFVGNPTRHISNSWVFRNQCKRGGVGPLVQGNLLDHLLPLLDRTNTKIIDLR